MCVTPRMSERTSRRAKHQRLLFEAKEHSKQRNIRSKGSSRPRRMSRHDKLVLYKSLPSTTTHQRWLPVLERDPRKWSTKHAETYSILQQGIGKTNDERMVRVRGIFHARSTCSVEGGRVHMRASLAVRRCGQTARHAHMRHTRRYVASSDAPHAAGLTRERDASEPY